uniref:Uncharacterized protein n=1 Tax=Glossina morsitans morsitans TaxID=37546 RepID=A0A1B0FJE3_GLOMM
MSFGFRKNLNTTPKKLKKLIKGETKSSKKQDKCNNFCEDESATDGTGNGERLTTAMGKTETIVNNPAASRDDNGNADLLNNIHFEKMGAAAHIAHHTANTPTQGLFAEQFAGSVGEGGQATLPGAGSRFGYRGPIRPSSTDITAHWQKDSHDNIQNNNCTNAGGSNTRGVLISNLKRRSKSAHAGRIISSSNESDGETREGVGARKSNQPKTITFNLKQNSTIEYDRRQFFDQPMVAGISSGYLNGRTANFINTGLQNNVIICPTPRLPAATYSKFTLQTVSLPKPEYAVPISINATTPTTPAGSYASSPVTNTGARAKDFITVRGATSTNQYAVTATQSQCIDPKTAKHMANSSTRRIFCGSREISADSGIASLDMALDSSTSSGVRSSSRHASPKRSRSRPRNLQMVMNGRGKFEVRDLDDSLSSESSSIVEPLALPKLPAENQTVPLPLSGLVRSNTVLSRESYELKSTQNVHDGRGKTKSNSRDRSNSSTHAPSEEDSESIDEEKLHLDRSATEKGIKERQFKDINTCSSKTSSPGSSIISSWCNGGESLAAKDFSNLSLSSNEDSNKKDNKLQEEEKEKETKIQLELNDDDLSILNTDMQISTISSLTETIALNASNDTDNVQGVQKEVPLEKSERPKCFYNAIDENKFAVMALEGSTFLLDDETSPTDSLVSSTESEEAPCKQKKHKINEELQEKDIDEISPELDVTSPNSPGTPTHASHSLSLSDCGNLIDDEIADQPALLFNHDSQDGGGGGGGGGESVTSRKDKADTPTLIESMSSMRNSVHSQTKSRSALHQAMELSLRTPLSLRKAVMERAESLDTLSPCESICSDDLMMDFDMNSSIDSIDRSASIKSRSGSDLNKIDDSELFTELDRKGNDVMKELSSILRSHAKKNKEKDISAHLPARATRLLNRSRIQQHCTLNNEDSDSTNKSPLSVRRNKANTASSRTSNASPSTGNSSLNSSLKRNQYGHHQHNYQQQQQQQQRLHQRDIHSSSDDLMLYDKSFRNAMIQDVLHFKKQLLRLRRILQETETLNPFENDNGQLFASCGLDSKLLDDIDLASLTTSTTDDPMHELADLRRQVVYLQGQVDDRDRTIRLQKNLIEKLEADKPKMQQIQGAGTPKECVNTATQTERTRPFSLGTDGLSRLQFGEQKK